MSLLHIKLSIIIVNYNKPFLIGKCIRSIARSHIPFPYEIIIIDNASEYSVKYQVSGIKKKYENLEIQLIENKENVGFGRANNQGVAKARGEFVLLLNTDIEVLDSAVEKLVLFAEKHPYTIVGGKLFNNDHTPQASCGPHYTLPVASAMLFLKGDHVGITRSSPSRITSVDWVSGACMLMKKEVYQNIGGFDEEVFMYMEEIEMCYRAKKQGINVLFYPEAHFIHLGAATSKSNTDPILNIYKGLLYLYRKHHPRQLPALKLLLKKKAAVSYILGVILNNSYLKTTYAKAYTLVG
jgi:GT2 family glycosyltransferase